LGSQSSASFAIRTQVRVDFSLRRRPKAAAIKAFWSVLKRRGMLWTPRYFAGSVGGAPLSVRKQYIEQQKGAATSSR
jgi:REP element-mobilizing transposase RayT